MNAENKVKISGICGVCSAGCGVHMQLENDKLKSLVPWKGHPRGVICPRGVKAPEIAYSKDRLTQPLKRVGPRGSGQFEEISWEEALATATEWLSAIRRSDPRKRTPARAATYLRQRTCGAGRSWSRMDGA